MVHYQPYLHTAGDGGVQWQSLDALIHEAGLGAPDRDADAIYDSITTAAGSTTTAVDIAGSINDGAVEGAMWDLGTPTNFFPDWTATTRGVVLRCKAATDPGASSLWWQSIGICRSTLQTDGVAVGLVRDSVWKIITQSGSTEDASSADAAHLAGEWHWGVLVLARDQSASRAAGMAAATTVHSQDSHGTGARVCLLSGIGKSGTPPDVKTGALTWQYFLLDPQAA